MRIAMPINWNLDASSLTNIARHNFRELGKIMNDTKSFTLSAIGIQSLGLGDFNQRYDLVHIPNMGGYRFATNAAHHCKKIVFGLSGIDEIIYGKDILVWKDSWKITEPIIKKEIENWKKYMQKINAIHVVTNSEYEEMHQYLGIPYEKMTIIPHGVDHDFFKPSLDKEKTRIEILSELNIPIEKYFLHVGESNYVRKNQHMIIKAFKNAKKSGLKHNLIIAGKHYPEIEEVAKKVPGVFVLDWIKNPQLLKLIQGADAFILPSIHEGFGMPLTEAMSCAVPCISSNKHAPPEVIGDSGILVNSGNSVEISQAMLKLANDPVLLETLSKKSLKQSEKFSWKKNAEQIFELYDVDPNKPMKNFDHFYDLAAYRTLVSVCDFFPDEKQNMILSLLRFDYDDLINWAINYGLDNPMTRDFLLPFEDWLQNYPKRN
jgi:glycosyltransferase involved in cell wall biosynthesis